MLVDLSDGMKLDGEPKPILVDLSDEKKPWMFTLDGPILWTAPFFGRPHSLDGLILWMLDGGLIPGTILEGWTASFYSGRWTIVHAGCSLWTAASFLERRPGGLLKTAPNSFPPTQNCRKKQIIFK